MDVCGLADQPGVDSELHRTAPARTARFVVPDPDFSIGGDDHRCVHKAGEERSGGEAGSDPALNVGVPELHARTLILYSKVTVAAKEHRPHLAPPTVVLGAGVKDLHDAGDVVLRSEVVQVGGGFFIHPLEREGNPRATGRADEVQEPLVLDGRVNELASPPADDIGAAFLPDHRIEDVAELFPHGPRSGPSCRRSRLGLVPLGLGPLDRGVDGPAGDERSLGCPGNLLHVGKPKFLPAIAESL